MLEADPKKKVSANDSYNAYIESERSKRQLYQEDLEKNHAVIGKSMRTIQLPLRHLKEVNIGVTPLH